MRKFVFLVRTVGQDLVRGQRDRCDVFTFTGVFSDLIVGQIRFFKQLAPPLLDGHNAGGENQRGALEQGHGGQADHGLAGPAGQDDDAAAAADIAASVKDVGGLALVVADVKRQACRRSFAKSNGQQGALGVAG